ncbi:MAG: hypothetical protein V4544_01395 [Pseudomonadota bacterium]
MSKNKFFVAYVATLLSSCAVFSADFDEGAGQSHVTFSASTAMSETPKKVDLGGVTYDLTPDTARYITKEKATILGTPGLKAEVENEFAGKRIPERHLSMKKAAAISDKKFERAQKMTQLSQRASLNQEKVSEQQRNKKLLASAQKRDVEHDQVARALQETLSKQRSAVVALQDKLSQSDVSVIDLVSKVDVFKKALSQLEAEKEKASAEDTEFFAELEAKMNTMTTQYELAQKALLSEKAAANQLRADLAHKEASLQATKSKEAALLTSLRGMALSGASLDAEFENAGSEDENGFEGAGSEDELHNSGAAAAQVPQQNEHQKPTATLLEDDDLEAF